MAPGAPLISGYQSPVSGLQRKISEATASEQNRLHTSLAQRTERLGDYR